MNAAKNSAITYLQFLTRGAPSNCILSILEYRRTGSNVAATSHFFDITDEGLELAAARAIQLDHYNRSNLYARVTLLKKRPKEGRGDRELTAGTNCLWVDYDCYKMGISIEVGKERLLSSTPKPSLLISSGGGIHAYWALESFQKSIPEIESRTNWLAKQFQADDCWAATQVLRIPGTHNHKNPAAITGVEILYYDSQLRYGLEKFGTAEPSHLPLSEVIATLQEEELPHDFLDTIPEKLMQRIVSGAGAPTKPDSGEVDRSENDWHITLVLLKKGYTPGQVMMVLTHPEWFVGEKARRDGWNYAKRTLARALEYQHKAQQAIQVQTGNEPILSQIIGEVLFYEDEKSGVMKKRGLNRGHDLVAPCLKFLRENEGVQLYVEETDRQGYIATSQGRVLPADPANAEFSDWVYELSGFTSEEKEHKVLRAGIASAARNEGDPAHLTPWCYTDQYTWVFRASLDRSSRTVIQVTPGTEPAAIPNGSQGILMQQSLLQETPVQYDPTITPDAAFHLFYEELTQKFAVDPVTRGLLSCYALAAPLIYGLPIQTLPLLHLTGDSGYGKSQTLGLISTFLHGTPKLLNTTTAAGYRIASREAMLPFDDYERISDEAKQFILTASTGIARQKSGKGTTDVITQQAHVLIALTSISQLEEEAVRRRAFVIPVNKVKWPVPGYAEDQWVRVANIRPKVWSGYMNWLAMEFLPWMRSRSFQQLVHQVEAEVPLEIFKSQAGFLALMYAIGSNVRKYVPKFLGMSPNADLRATIQAWAHALAIDEREELLERDPLLVAMAHVFESARRGPEGEVFQFRYELPGTATQYTEWTKVIQTVLRDKEFRVHTVDGHVLSAQASAHGGVWFGLEGSTTEWLATLRTIDRAFPKMNPKSLGWSFARLVGNEQLKHGFEIERLKGVGPTKSSNGWRVLIKL